MNLTLDIGNTRTKWGIFGGRQLVQQGVWDFADVERLHGLVQQNGVKQAIICSVGWAEFADELAKSLSASCKARVFSVHSPLPLTVSYKTPETLGTDRLAAVMGAISLYKNINVLVIDAGTCVTVDFADASGNYHGGSISPGVQMRLDAMHHFTQRLPSLTAEEGVAITGLSTAECMQSGAVMGMLLELEGRIKHYLNQTGGGLQVVTTGGNGALVAAQIPLPVQLSFDPNLTLIGLNEALLYTESPAGKS